MLKVVPWAMAEYQNAEGVEFAENAKVLNRYVGLTVHL